jgi:hypothetical protein
VRCRGAYEEGDPLLFEDYLDDRFPPTTLCLRFDERDARAACDFPNLHPGIFLANRRAADALAHLFVKSCRSHEVQIASQSFTIFVCDRYLDGFDPAASDYSRYESTGRVERIRTVALKKGFVASFDVFRLKGDKAVYVEVFVTDEFKSIYDANGFTGLGFKPVYTSNQTP